MVVRRLILDDDDLIMVVNKDIVRQIDENRGEMNRTEFTNFLIHNYLKECEKSKNYIRKEEFYRVVQEIKVFLMDFFDAVLAKDSSKQIPVSDFEEFFNKIKTLGSSQV